MLYDKSSTWSIQLQVMGMMMTEGWNNIFKHLWPEHKALCAHSTVFQCSSEQHFQVLVNVDVCFKVTKVLQGECSSPAGSIWATDSSCCSVSLRQKENWLLFLVFYMMWKVKKEHVGKDNLPVAKGWFPALDRVSLLYQRGCLLALVTVETGVHSALGAVVEMEYAGCLEISQ